MKARKLTDEHQMRLNFQTVEHSRSRPPKSANDTSFKGVSRRLRWSRGTFEIATLADVIQAEDRLRLLEPTSLPKILRGWSPRPRPKTAIIALAARAAYERRGGDPAEAIRKFLGQRADRLRALADRLRVR